MARDVEEAARRGVRHAREWLRTEMTDAHDLALEIRVSEASRRDCGEERDAAGWCYWDAYIQELQYAQQQKASGGDGG